MRFLHAADIHLGYAQYGEKERYNDFGRAYLRMMRAAIAERVDFVLLAGDLFNQRDVDPQTLLLATRGLTEVRDAGIPVLVVEGNHERPHWHDQVSWLDYLAQAGLLKELSPWYGDDGLVLAPWDAGIHAGAYVDLPGGVRVYGHRYVGASTARTIEELAARLAEQPRAAYSILMLHAGVEGVLPKYNGGLTHAQLAPLRPFADYVALGHIHKPFAHDEWLYNPGSLESNSVEEVAWPERGYYLVDVDVAARSHRARLAPGERRAFVRLHYDVTPLKTPGEVAETISLYLAAQAARQCAVKPVVELTLTGSLAFAAADLPLEALRLRAEESFDALLARVQNHATPPGWDVPEVEGSSRVELERYVLRELVGRDEWRREQSEAWVDAALRLKEMALRRDAPETIIAQVHELADQLPREDLA
jgi:DNA repair exonuclease SbcCD nuclease subunit